MKDNRRFQCKYCKWWEDDTEDYSERETDGICHRFPPRQEEINHKLTVEFFPGVNEDDWCGEFQIK